MKGKFISLFFLQDCREVEWTFITAIMLTALLNIFTAAISNDLDDLVSLVWHNLLASTQL
jgi:hypothetical protein